MKIHGNKEEWHSCKQNLFKIEKQEMLWKYGHITTLPIVIVVPVSGVLVTYFHIALVSFLLDLIYSLLLSN